MNEGSIKFRNRDSWNQNWGGADFPSGKVAYFGENIKVNAGTYRITLILTENQYHFEKLD